MAPRDLPCAASPVRANKITLVEIVRLSVPPTVTPRTPLILAETYRKLRRRWPAVSRTMMNFCSHDVIMKNALYLILALSFPLALVPLSSKEQGYELSPGDAEGEACKVEE